MMFVPFRILETKTLEYLIILNWFYAIFYVKIALKRQFWLSATLVNACWPHVCDMTKYILGTCKYLSEVPFPQISCPDMQNSSWGDRINHIFFPTGRWWNNHLQIIFFHKNTLKRPDHIWWRSTRQKKA